MRLLLFFFFNCLCIAALQASAQTGNLKDTTAAKQQIVAINAGLDNAVTNKQADYLQKHFAPDFYFLHSTGQVDSKKSWMQYVLDTATRYRSRTHDSVTVELHGDVAILTGILTVTRTAQTKITGYVLRYIRLYAYRQNRWQLLSHRSLNESHLPDESL